MQFCLKQWKFIFTVGSAILIRKFCLGLQILDHEGFSSLSFYRDWLWPLRVRDEEEREPFPHLFSGGTSRPFTIDDLCKQGVRRTDCKCVCERAKDEPPSRKPSLIINCYFALKIITIDT